MKSVEEVKAYFTKDEFVQGIGVEIVELTKEKAVVKATVKPCHCNANGCAQGGMLYTVADYAFALLANYLHAASVTQGGHVQYLRPAALEELTFTARETACVGRNTASEVLVTNRAGEIVCVCHFIGFIKEA
jgi:acyl-CoA thioesterase